MPFSAMDFGSDRNGSRKISSTWFRSGKILLRGDSVRLRPRAIAFPYENGRKKPFAAPEFIPILRALRIRA